MSISIHDTAYLSHDPTCRSFLGSQLCESHDRIWRLAALHSDIAGPTRRCLSKSLASLVGDSDDDMGTASRFEEDEDKAHRWEYYRFEIVFVNATITKLGITSPLRS